jgi:hypothetical protein
MCTKLYDMGMHDSKRKVHCIRQKPSHFDKFPQAVFCSAFFHSSISSVERVLSILLLYSSSLGGRGAHATGEEGGEASLWEVRGGAHSGTTERWAVGDKPRETAGLLVYAEVSKAGVWVAEFQPGGPGTKASSGSPRFAISTHSLNRAGRQV